MKINHYHIHSQQYSLKSEEMPVEPQEEKQHPEAQKQSSSTWLAQVLRATQASFIACVLFMFLPVLFVFVGCASTQKNILTLPIDSSQFTKYYSKHDSRSEFYLRPEYRKMAIEFNSQEASVPRQGIDEYRPKAIKIGLHYYEIGRFLIGDYLYKLVMYHDSTIGGASSLVLQLNSYNSEGIMLDALIVDDRYGYEGIETFRQFKMEQNLISIDDYITVLFYMNADPIIVMENPVPQVSSKAQYRIGNGRFILISKEDFKLW